MQPAHSNAGTEGADVLNNVVPSSFTPVGEHPREEILVAMLGSHPWTAADEAVINIVNEHGQNLAHLCAQLGHNKLLLAVIEWGIDIRTKDANGWTPLDFARLHGNEEAVDILEGDWIDPVDSKRAAQLHDMPHDPNALSNTAPGGATVHNASPSFPPTKRKKERKKNALSSGLKPGDIKLTVPSPSPANELATTPSPSMGGPLILAMGVLSIAGVILQVASKTIAAPPGVARLDMQYPNRPSMGSSEEHRMKYEVLVFDGPGICPVSREGLVNSLNTALAFNYWVGTIDHEGLRTEPWTSSCVLLVFPHCTHTRPYDALDADVPTISRIGQFVEGGGSFLGICGGAYFASKSAEWNGHPWGSANLAFWPWVSKGPYLREGPQTHEFTLPFLIDRSQLNGVSPNYDAPYCDLHFDGGGQFICYGDNDAIPFTPMGCYSSNKYAGVGCTVGTGTAVLWHARLECSFRNREVEHGFKAAYGTRQYDVEVCFGEDVDRGRSWECLQKLERYRLRVFRHTLLYLKLQPAPEIVPRPPLSPLPQFLVSAPTSYLRQRPYNPFAHLRPGVVSGEHEVFEFRPFPWVTAPNWAVIRDRAAHHCEPATGGRRIWVICPEELPDRSSYTPHFNLARYFELLENARGHQLPSYPLGNNVLYGEAVTSTQTQLLQ